MNHQTTQFLLVAKQAEINALEQLSANCLLVTGISELVHQLQRERGISNIFLASGCELFAQQRQQQLLQTTIAEQQLRTQLTQQYLQAKDLCNNSRLLNGIALALLGLDKLAALREQISKQQLMPSQSTEAYSSLIATWLVVVQDSTDLVCDADITRLLVALFNLLQIKEYAGQERAWGAIGLASGRLTTTLGERLLLLQQAQQQSSVVFLEFASEEQQLQWHQQEQGLATKQLQQLRTLMQQLSGTTMPVPAVSDLWYQFATERMDEMHLLQIKVTAQLQKLTFVTVSAAQQQLQCNPAKLPQLSEQPMNLRVNIVIDPFIQGMCGFSATPLLADHLSINAPNRSFYQLLSEQAQHIRMIQTELAETRQVMSEQKLIDRAKLLLMQYKNLSEAQAYRQLQQSAMKQRSSIADVADAVIKLLM
ncbi:nitrate- and nitrite sensing domain-containing protein [Vibrio cholerae]|nr:nitrate- and nitrite sensing domain-containing protein [Vibrio cholerae]EKF9606309.1 nitrate- and nitrite sensing domain-containing protein [Vibrio cholerae]